MRFLVAILIFLAPLYGTKDIDSRFVDPKLFSGLWYEIARTPNVFEEGCVSPTVEYVLQQDLSYKVLNRCFKDTADGELVEYNGRAQSVRGTSMDTMAMTYFWIFTKIYNVVYLDDYKIAVVADEDFDYVWLMHREPYLSQTKKQNVLNFLNEHMDISRFIYPEQVGVSR